MAARKRRARFFILFPAVLCLLLCACQADRARKDALSLLEEQKIDSARDAFLVDTGGRLGTLLVTVESCEAEKDLVADIPFPNYELHFSVWDPLNMDIPLQTMVRYASQLFDSVSYHVSDYNFDGHADFTWRYYLSASTGLSYLWLWDEDQGQFVEEPAYAKLSNPLCDPEKQAISSTWRTGADSRVDAFYRWIDGSLTLVRRIEIHQPQGNMQLVTVEDLTDGQMEEVYHEELDLTTMKEIDPRVDGKWYDLDYHSER